MEPALESEATFLHIKWEVIDVESAGRDNLDGLIVAHQTIMCHIDIRNVWRFPNVYTTSETEMTAGLLRSKERLAPALVE